MINHKVSEWKVHFNACAGVCTLFDYISKQRSLNQSPCDFFFQCVFVFRLISLYHQLHLCSFGSLVLYSFAHHESVPYFLLWAAWLKVSVLFSYFPMSPFYT